jgi:hypothetical protein
LPWNSEAGWKKLMNPKHRDDKWRGSSVPTARPRYIKQPLPASVTTATYSVGSFSFERKELKLV